MKEITQFVIRYPILSISWISLLTIVLFNTFKCLTSKVRNITTSEATRLINREDAVVIDLRQYSDFCRGHIVGSIHIFSNEIETSDVSSELKKYKDKPIIVVDSIGIQSHRFANKLIKAGFEKICVLREGISGWNAENLPLVQSK